MDNLNSYLKYLVEHKPDKAPILIGLSSAILESSTIIFLRFCSNIDSNYIILIRGLIIGLINNSLLKR